MSIIRTNLTPQPNRKLSKHEFSPRQSTVRAGRHQGRRAVRLIITEGSPDDEALRSVVDDWLVPLLVEQFFAERGLEAPQPRNRSAFLKPVYRTPVQGARAEKRVDKSL